jgi:hypothetical protein
MITEIYSNSRITDKLSFGKNILTAPRKRLHISVCFFDDLQSQTFNEAFSKGLE